MRYSTVLNQPFAGVFFLLYELVLLPDDVVCLTFVHRFYRLILYSKFPLQKTVFFISKMPPKSKAVAAKRPTPDSAPQKAARIEVAPSKPVPGGARPKVDAHWPGGGQVYQDPTTGLNWSAMLNQTNIGQNNNKFYVVQLIDLGSNKYAVFTRWGRVGEVGQNSQFNGSLDAMQKQFADKFKDKTKNSWDVIKDDHTQFKKFPDKYTLVETAVGAEDAPVTVVAGATAGAAPVACKASALHANVQKVLSIIFDKDMFARDMKAQNIDANRMPLGKLDKAQISAGYKALEALQAALAKGKASRVVLAELSSAFYSIIPHDFGRATPPIIDNDDMLTKKFDLLNTLADIQLAVAMDASATANKATLAEHPLDRQYRELNCGLMYVDPSSDEFKIINRYKQETQSYPKCSITHALRVDRPQDRDRMAAFKSVTNRRLLWHGTSVSVVAAILKTGLRIMPHAGGRVGKGLYFASENGKSAAYVRCDNHVGFMFLVEVVLGDAQEIGQDDSSLTYQKVETQMKKDSIIARGRTEPDPMQDIKIKGEWQDIVVPQGKPIEQPKWKSSTFSQSEYLVYDEGRARIKYILQMKF